MHWLAKRRCDNNAMEEAAGSKRVRLDGVPSARLPTADGEVDRGDEWTEEQAAAKLHNEASEPIDLPVMQSEAGHGLLTTGAAEAVESPAPAGEPLAGESTLLPASASDQHHAAAVRTRVPVNVAAADNTAGATSSASCILADESAAMAESLQATCSSPCAAVETLERSTSVDSTGDETCADVSSCHAVASGGESTAMPASTRAADDRAVRRQDGEEGEEEEGVEQGQEEGIASGRATGQVQDGTIASNLAPTRQSSLRVVVGTEHSTAPQAAAAPEEATSETGTWNTTAAGDSQQQRRRRAPRRPARAPKSSVRVQSDADDSAADDSDVNGGRGNTCRGASLSSTAVAADATADAADATLDGSTAIGTDSDSGTFITAVKVQEEGEAEEAGGDD